MATRDDGRRVMVRSNLAQLIEQKSQRDGVRITKHRISKETGVAINTIKRYLRSESISYFDNDVISSFCQFFECQVGDLLKTMSIGESAENNMTAEE